MELTREYALDTAKAEEGVEVPFGDDGFIIVAHAKNKNFRRELQQLLKPHQRRYQRGTLPDHVLEECTLKAVSKHVLLGWRGITVNGEPVEYSPEKAFEFMKEFPEFGSEVLDAANTRALFVAETIEANEKNS